MACENRQKEVRPDALVAALAQAGREVHRRSSLTEYLDEHQLPRHRSCQVREPGDLRHPRGL